MLIAIKDAVAFKSTSLDKDDQGRYISLTCEINNIYTLMNVYLPNVKPLSFLKKGLEESQSCQTGQRDPMWRL